MGSEDFYPEERPVHRVSVDGFWMDTTPVTAAQFRRFVRETAYVTVAERPLDAALYPDADPKTETRRSNSSMTASSVGFSEIRSCVSANQPQKARMSSSVLTKAGRSE
jgi:formylglycine-generating enzyme required for sulfatase activity